MLQGTIIKAVAHVSKLSNVEDIKDKKKY